MKLLSKKWLLAATTLAIIAVAGIASQALAVLLPRPLAAE